MKKDSSSDLFIYLGDGRGLIIYPNHTLRILDRCGQGTSPELLDFPELIRAAQKWYERSTDGIELHKALDSFQRRTASGKKEPRVSAQGAKIQNPPKIAEFLLTALATSRAAEAMVGDLTERFADECEKFGHQRAVRLYWARTLRSLWPLLRRAIGKALKWGAVIAAVRRLF